MKMSLSSSLLVSSIATALAFLATLQTTAGQDDNPFKKLATAITAFSTELIMKLVELNPGKNIGICSACCYITLAAAHLGAGGDTKSQLATLLHIDNFDDETEFYDSIKVLLQTLGSTQKEYTLKMVNKLYAAEELEFSEEFLQKLDEYFGTKPEELDFSGDPEGSAAQINKWVSRMTSGKITELYPDDVITSDTHVALASAAYFSAPWLYKFDKKNTKNQAFYTTDKKKVQVPMMSMTSNPVLSYFKMNDTLIVELPHATRKVSTFIGLLQPGKNTADSSAQRRRVLDSSKEELTMRPKNVTMKVSIPKFTYSTSIDLTDALMALGLDDAFDVENADLSDIDSEHSVPLEEMMHQASFSFSEEGSMASGTNEGILRRVSSASKKAMEFIVDRPFCFAVFEMTTGCCLFKGYVVNPKKSD